MKQHELLFWPSWYSKRSLALKKKTCLGLYFKALLENKRNQRMFQPWQVSRLLRRFFIKVWALVQLGGKIMLIQIKCFGVTKTCIKQNKKKWKKVIPHCRQLQNLLRLLPELSYAPEYADWQIWVNGPWEEWLLTLDMIYFSRYRYLFQSGDDIFVYKSAVMN